MRQMLGFAYCVAAITLCSRAAVAQLSGAPIPSALPGVSQMSPANAAGVLKYCERKGLVSVVGTDEVLAAFATKPDTASADYVVGESGQILGDGGKNFSLSKAPGYLQSRACDMVLDRAKTFPR